MLLKIIQACSEAASGGQAQGWLYGAEQRSVLEVTNCFAIPQKVKTGEMSKFKEAVEAAIDSANGDKAQVGVFYGTSLSSFCTESFIDIHFRCQSRLGPNAIALIYDSVHSTKGQLHLKALRFTPLFMQAYESGSFDVGALDKLPVFTSEVFEELPVTVTTSALTKAYISQLRMDLGSTGVSCDFDRLTLGADKQLEANLRHIVQRLSELTVEQETLREYETKKSSMVHKQEQWKEKRKEENEQLAMEGKPLKPELPTTKEVKEQRLDYFLPLSDESKPFKLRSTVYTLQLQKDVAAINQQSVQNFGRLFLMNAVK